MTLNLRVFTVLHVMYCMLSFVHNNLTFEPQQLFIRAVMHI